MLKLNDIIKSKNIIDLFDDDQKEETSKITYDIINGYKIDYKSGEAWRLSMSEAMDLAKQVVNKKSFPWEGAANIKYPLITQAAINFAARLFPEIVPNDVDIVETISQGLDPQNKKYERGHRVSECMSYQCSTSPDWKEHIDRLLHILPVVGTVFTKSYYSELEKRNCVEVVPPDQIIVNHDTTTSLPCASRITHIITVSLNHIVSQQRMGNFCKDIDVELLRPTDSSSDENYQVTLLEQQCWLDLDEDGYKEPYVVTVHEPTQKIFRIVARIKPNSIRKNSEGEIYYIAAIDYFQDYHFIRSPDGGYYSMGFGQFLLPLNKAINTLLNQLLDAGTLSVTQGGFLGKGLRLKPGALQFKPFEWKVCDAASGDDLKKNVYEFPVREPSATLLQLLTLLINVGKELTSATEAMNGNMSASNVASQTYNGLVEQGAKVFEAINRRLYDSLTLSFKKLYELNYYYLTDKEYQSIINIPEGRVKEDFNLTTNDVRPVADPKLSSMAQRMSKLNVIMNLRTADPRAVDTYMLQTLNFDKNQIEVFLPAPDPNAPPPPETIKIMSEAELNKANANLSLVKAQSEAGSGQLNLAKTSKDIEFIDSQINESATRSWKIMKDGSHNDQKNMIVLSKMQAEEKIKSLMASNQALQTQLTSILKNKELDIKAASEATKHAVSLKKIEEDKKTNG